MLQFRRGLTRKWVRSIFRNSVRLVHKERNLLLISWSRSGFRHGGSAG